MYRRIVTTVDVDIILTLYCHKNPIDIIAEKTGYTIGAIMNIIESNKNLLPPKTAKGNYSKRSKYARDMTIEDRAHEAVRMYEHNYPVQNISKVLGLSLNTVKLVLEKSGILDNFQYSMGEITVDKIEAFKDLVNIGDRYLIEVEAEKKYFGANSYYKYHKIIEVEVLEKYPHFVSTNKGSFQYFDLYIGIKQSSRR